VVDVPTKTEFDALTLRVTALEAKLAQIEKLVQVGTDTVDALYLMAHPT
jgi:hypothetical protein